MLRRKDSEGKLMIHIALLNGNFDTVRYLMAEWPQHLNQLTTTLESMSVLHLALVSAFTVPKVNIATEELLYSLMLT